MINISIDKIKCYSNNSTAIVMLMTLPMMAMFFILLASNELMSGDVVNQLNITFIHTSILAYTHVIVPFVAIFTTLKDLVKFKSTDNELLKIVISSISVFITMSNIFCNFQLSLGLEVLDFETCIYYTAVLMIEFIAISFFIFGAYLLGIWLKGKIKNK